MWGVYIVDFIISIFFEMQEKRNLAEDYEYKFVSDSLHMLLVSRLAIDVDLVLSVCPTLIYFVPN